MPDLSRAELSGWEAIRRIPHTLERIASSLEKIATILQEGRGSRSLPIQFPRED